MNPLLAHYYSSSDSEADKPFDARRIREQRQQLHQQPPQRSHPPGSANRQLFDWSSESTPHGGSVSSEHGGDFVTETSRDERAALAKHLMRLEAEENRLGPAVDQQENAVRALPDRTRKWKDRVNMSTASLKRDLTELRERECTFSPAINRSRRPTGGGASHHHAGAEVDVTVSDDSGDDGGEPYGAARRNDHHSVFDRLHSKSVEMRQKREAAAAVKSEQELAGCSFRPYVVKAPWTAAVQPRYLDPVEPHAPSATTLHGFGEHGLAHVSHDDVSAAGHQRGPSQADRQDSLTFRPITNRHVPPMVSEYLREPVHERLARSPAVNRRARGAGDAEDDHSPMRPSVHRRALTPAQRHDFEQRLAEDIARRKAARDSYERQKELEKPKGQPTINRFAAIDKLTPAQRKEMVEERRRKLEAERARIAAELYPSTSIGLSKKSAQILANRPESSIPLSVRYAEELKRKEEKLESKRRAAELAELKEVVGKPTLGPPPPTSETNRRSASLGQAIAGSLDDYKDYLARVERERLKDLAGAKTTEEAALERELGECTFTPQVHDAPEYIKHIAAARAASRSSFTWSIQHHQHPH